MMEAIVNDAEIEFVVFESEILHVLETPGIGSELRAVHPDVEIRNGDILESGLKERGAIAFASASDKYPHIGAQDALKEELLRSVLVMINHEGRRLSRLAQEAG